MKMIVSDVKLTDDELDQVVGGAGMGLGMAMETTDPTPKGQAQPQPPPAGKATQNQAGQSQGMLIPKRSQQASSHHPGEMEKQGDQRTPKL
jgi:hypothetical protein